jgi:three-Cys-motif partner protein
MAKRSRPTSKGKAHRFGGDWTQTKLRVLKDYLAAYTKALKDKPSADKPFRKAYIDAFAGTGYRTARERGMSSTSDNLLFPDLADAAPQTLLAGSAKLALEVEPRFDKYVFIERDAERCQQLEELKSEFPALAEDIDVRQGEANNVIQKLCAPLDAWKTLSRRSLPGRRSIFGSSFRRDGGEPAAAEVRQGSRLVAAADGRISGADGLV